MPINARVTFSDGRSAIITGETREEIQAAVTAYEQQIQAPGASIPPPEVGATEEFVGPPAPPRVELTPNQQKQIADLEALKQTPGQSPEAIEQQIEAIRQGRSAIRSGAETGVSLLRSALAEPIAGVAGLFQLARGLSNNEAVKTVSDVRERIGGKGPVRTESREFMEALAVPFAAYENGVEWAATRMSLGNPVAATAIHTTLMALPDAIAGYAAGGTKAASRAAIRREAQRLQDVAQGLNISLDGTNWRTSVRDAAQQLAPSERATGMDALVNRMRQERDASAAALEQAYTNARQSRAWISTPSTKTFAQGAVDDLMQQGYDVAQMPTLQRRANELINLDTTLPSNPSVKLPANVVYTRLNEVELVRRRINQSLRDSNLSRPEASALRNFKRDLDTYLDNQFNTAAIRGDADALNAWKNARDLARGHAERFTDNRALKQLIELEATPEQYRNWIMGASDKMPPAMVADTVKRLKNVVGVDSPEMNGLRLEFTRGLMQPLMRQDPDWGQFMNGVDQFVARNPSLVRELGFDTSVLADLRKMVGAFDRNLPDTFWTKNNPYSLIARFTVGHSIARKAAMVAMTATGLRWFVGRVFGGQSRAVQNELFGMDFTKPLIPKRGVAAGAIIAGAAADELGVPYNEEEVLPRSSYAALLQQMFGEQAEAPEEQ